MIKFLILFLSIIVATPIQAEGVDIIFTKSETLNQYSTRIPFKLVDHLIVVEAELLSKKGNFIIDTGSESLILNKSHFNSVYIQKQKTTQSFGVLNAIDNAVEKRLDIFVLNQFTLKHKTANIINLSHIEINKKIKLLGIIGYNILKDYEIFIDLYLNQITLTKLDKNGNKLNSNVYLEKIVDSVDFKLKHHSIILNAQLNGETLKFGLDSAAELNQINKNVKPSVLKYFYPNKRIKLTGIGNKTIEVIAGNLHRVKLSKKTYFGPMRTVLTNLRNMNKAFGTNLDGILGYEFFRQKRTIINYKKEKLYFIDYPIFKQ